MCTLCVLCGSVVLFPRRIVNHRATENTEVAQRRVQNTLVQLSDNAKLAPRQMTSILLFGLLAAGANVLGGLVLVKSGAHRMGERFLKYLVALGAGFMLAAIFIEILPGTVGIWLECSPRGVAR